MSFILGQQLVRQKEFGKALNIFLNLEKKKLKDSKIYFYLGMINFELNNFDKSIFYYEKFLQNVPNSISALHNLAIVKQSTGDIDVAKEIYLKLIEIDIYNIRPYYGLFTLNENYLTDENFKIINQIKKIEKLSLYEKGIINFLLSKKEKKIKNYKKEIEYLENFHLDIFNSSYEYNISSQFYHNQIISKNYKKIKIIGDNEKIINKDEINPIFIIGLPRSGSTLIESVLTSGSDNIKSFGESHIFNMSIFEQIGPEIYNKEFDIQNFIFQIDKKLIKKSVIKRYLNFNLINNLKNQIFVDKSLENFFNIEIILNVFPKAKFLHTFRNSKDSVISIFQSMLSELSWTHKIEDILEYIDNYHQVLDYYKSKYPNQIMDINLEKFTNSSEAISKEIYKFCSLNWSKETLNFYKRKDLYTKTLSFAQVRKKISRYNNSKYLPYLYLLENYKHQYDWIN